MFYNILGWRNKVTCGHLVQATQSTYRITTAHCETWHTRSEDIRPANGITHSESYSRQLSEWVIPGIFREVCVKSISNVLSWFYRCFVWPYCVTRVYCKTLSGTVSRAQSLLRPYRSEGRQYVLTKWTATISFLFGPVTRKGDHGRKFSTSISWDTRPCCRLR